MRDRGLVWLSSNNLEWRFYEEVLPFIRSGIGAGFRGFSLLKPEARADVAPTQFSGDLTFYTGDPAPVGTIVKFYLDGTLKGQVTTIANGFYAITDYDPNYPTGTYLIRAESGGFYGAEYFYHTQGTTTENCDIVLRWALP